MGSIYNIEDRIERIERYLGIDDSKRIQEKNDYINIQNEGEQWSEHLDDSKREIERLLSEAKRVQLDLEKYNNLIELLKKKKL